MLSKLSEVSQADIDAQKAAEKKKKEEAAKKAVLLKKQKEEEAKENEMEKSLDPELKIALQNDKFTEDMLGMLLKESDLKPG